MSRHCGLYLLLLSIFHTYIYAVFGTAHRLMKLELKLMCHSGGVCEYGVSVFSLVVSYRIALRIQPASILVLLTLKLISFFLAIF